MRTRRVLHAVTTVGLVAAVAAGVGLTIAVPAQAADVWTYQGTFTLDGLFTYMDPSQAPGPTVFKEPRQLDLFVDMRVEDGRIVDATVLSPSMGCMGDGRSATIRFRSGYGCTGSVTFTGMGTPNLALANVNIDGPANDRTPAIFTTAPTSTISGVNVSPAKPALPPLTPSMLSVTAGKVDPVRKEMLVRVSVLLPQTYPSVKQALTLTPAGGSTTAYVADTWQAIPCGLPTDIGLTVTGTNTDPGTQATSVSYTANCTPRSPTLRLTTRNGNAATFSYSLTDGGPMESATWTLTSRFSGTAQTGAAMPIGGGSGADFTVTGLRPGERYSAQVAVTSAGGQVAQSNVVDVWTSPPTFTYPAITGKVGAPITPVRPTPAVDPKSISQLAATPALPPGLRIDPPTGIISGTPTAAGSGTVGLQFLYAGSTNPKQIEQSPGAITFTIVSGGPETAFGDVTLVGEVGVPITPVSLAKGTANLPAGATFTSPALCALGLRVDPTTGVVSGTPNKAVTAAGGKAPAYLVVTGSAGDGCRVTGKQLSGRSSTGIRRSYGSVLTTITTPSGPRIWYTPGVTMSKQVHGVVGSTLTVPAPSIAGANAPTFAVSSGVLPPGLTIDPATGAIGGVPTAAASGVTIGLRATDAGGQSSTPLTVAFDISSQASTLTLGYPNPVSVHVGQALSVSASGTITGQRFVLDAASAAAGLAVDPITGRVTWVPGGAQVGTRTVTVTETSPGLGPTSTSFAVQVLPVSALGTSAQAASGASALSGTGASAATANAGASGATGGGGASSGSVGSGTESAPCIAPTGTLYSDMTASVGSTMTYAPNIRDISRPVSYRISDGTLPAGVVLDSTYGVVSGTPTSANGGIGAVTIQASFADGTVRSSTFNIAVDDPHQSANYPNRIIGTVGGPTAIFPETFDTTGPTSYTLVCGELPSGMALDAKTGIIAGTPTAPVDFPIPLRVRQKDAYGSVDASLIMVVGAAPTPWIRYPDHPLATFGKRVSITPTLSELPKDAVFRLTGKLPKGLRFDQRTGVIAGTSTSSIRSRALTVTAYGADGRAIASTATSISIRQAAVPLSITAKSTATKVTRNATVLVSKARHPSWAKITTRVSCTGCTWRADARTGRVTVTPGPRTTRVTVTITATVKQANITYRPHVWTRTWLIRK